MLRFSPNASLRRAFQGHRILSSAALASILIASFGCDSAPDTETIAQTPKQADIADSETGTNPPEVAPENLNEQGQIVLGDPATSNNAVETVAAKADTPQYNLTTEAQRNQVIAADWPEPQAVLFLSGQQHGYIEPCGCTGLENQKGGLIRRDTLLTSLRDRGWDLVPLDVGNQVRRTGRQATMKFQSTVDGFKLMDYKAVTLGLDDLKLSGVELIQIAGTDGANELPFISANIVVFDESFFPKYKIIEAGGRKIGVTGILGAEYQSKLLSSDVEFTDPVTALRPVVDELKSEGCDFLVLLAHASIEESAKLAAEVDAFNLVVTAGGFGEPTLLPEEIPGSKAVMVQVGTKGMWGGIVGLFDDPKTPLRYQKIAISSQFEDSKRMLAQFANYQQRLKEAGLEGLGATPMKHQTGRQYVGSEVCGDCHTTAHDIWVDSPHIHATESIVAANNDRGGIPRHHDPECISCHVTGWDPKGYQPYATGWESLEKSELLAGSGCENCHGPGSEHVAAENGDIDVTSERLKELQQQMVLTLENAEARCRDCHDLDNSPEFDFASYWEEVKHYGKD
ncbi:MAG: hypothetical protein Aurels2KO_15570 [Aureliella sp.]